MTDLQWLKDSVILSNTRTAILHTMEIGHHNWKVADIRPETANVPKMWREGSVVKRRRAAFIEKVYFVF